MGTTSGERPVVQSSPSSGSPRGSRARPAHGRAVPATASPSRSTTSSASPARPDRADGLLGEQLRARLRLRHDRHGRGRLHAGRRRRRGEPVDARGVLRLGRARPGRSARRSTPTAPASSPARAAWPSCWRRRARARPRRAHLRRGARLRRRTATREHMVAPHADSIAACIRAAHATAGCRPGADRLRLRARHRHAQANDADRDGARCADVFGEPPCRRSARSSR